MSKHVTVSIDRDSEIGRALEDPGIDRVMLEVDGRRFEVVKRLGMTEDEHNRYWQALSFSEHVAKLGNPFEGMDVDQLIEDIYRWREKVRVTTSRNEHSVRFRCAH